MSSSSSSVSVSNSEFRSFLQEINLVLQRPVLELACKKIFLEDVIEYDKTSPEAAIASMGMRKIKAANWEKGNLSLEDKKIIKCCSDILSFISSNKDRINSLRRLRIEDPSSYQTTLRSCSVKDRDIVEFLTNASTSVSRAHLDAFEEARADLDAPEEPSSNTNGYSYPQSFSTNWNSPSPQVQSSPRSSPSSYDPCDRYCLYDLYDPTEEEISSSIRVNSANGMTLVDDLEEDRKEGACSLVSSSDVSPKLSRSEKTRSDSSDQLKRGTSSRAQKSDSVRNLALQYSSCSQNARIAFDKISWVNPEDRIQYLIIAISKLQFDESECVELMRLLKNFEQEETRFMRGRGERAIKQNDYFFTIRYLNGVPNFVKKDDLPGLIASYQYIPILPYSQLRSEHPNKRITENFLNRVNQDVKVREADPRLIEMRRQMGFEGY